MPRRKTGRTAATSDVAKARKDTETTSIDKSKNLDPNLATTTKPRRSPRNHGAVETTAKEHPLSKGNGQLTIGNHLTTKKDANVRNNTTLRPTTEATITSKAATKSSQKSKVKAKAAVQSNRRTRGRPKKIDPVPPSTSTRHIRPKSSQKSKDKAKAAVQSNHRTRGRPKKIDPVPPPTSARHIRPGRGPKVSANSKQRAGRDSERSASRHRTKHQGEKADDPRKTSAIGRDTQNKVSSQSITVLIPAPIDNAETLHATEPQVGPIQEDHCASGSRQPLTREALERLAQELEPIHPINRNRSGEESEDGSSPESIIDSQERFNRKWGYVPPLDEETIRIIEAIIKNPARAETMVGIGPEKEEFLSGLHSRNVLLDPSTHLDPREEEIQSISLEGYLQETKEQETFHEELWRSDKAKCTPNSSEALYQRTLMINLIARHILIYQFDSSKKQILDFSVEEPWGCLPMPSRLLWAVSQGQKSEAKFLTQPKPDLAICFKREAVISDRMWKTLPEPTKKLACFENCFSKGSRIFHFLAVEAKKAMLDIDSPQALYQCLNNASQALHNMFEFFRDAGPEHEQVFYNKVRFFSVVANRNGIIVRIHRAIRKPDDASPYELVMPNQPGYRLEFEFREFQRICGEDKFSRKKVLGVVRKILKYATDDLFMMINAAASKLVQNLEKDVGLYLARGEADFYSYGQPNPKTSKSSRRTSVVPSTIGDRVQRQFRRANLGSKCAPSDQSIASGQTRTKQPHQRVISRLATTIRKRGADEIELDELEDMQALDPLVRKRRRPSCSNSKLSLPCSATGGFTVGSQ